MRPRSTRPVPVLILLVFPFLFVGCGASGGGSLGRTDAMARLNAAIGAPIESSEQGQENSRLVQRIVEEGWLEALFRHEVADLIGQGSPCAAHPTCAEQGFSGDDWYFAVGTTGTQGPVLVPALILGFDGTGRVARIYYQRTH